MYKFLSDSKDSLSKRAKYLKLSSSILSESLSSGSFNSFYKGQGLSFSGVREYLPGDDVRAIDWNVTARMSKPFVKEFEEEREIQFFVILDRSISMFTGSCGNVKYKTACEIAALLLFLAENMRNPFGAVIFDGEIDFSLEPKLSEKQTMLLLSKFDRVEKVVPGSVLKNALLGAAKLLKKRSLVFVISDFRAEGWQDSFKILCQKNLVAPICITDNSDWEIENVGSVPFTDGESGRRMVLPTNLNSFKAQWKEEFKARINRWKDFCIRQGSKPLIISTEDDVLRHLSVFLKKI